MRGIKRHGGGSQGGSRRVGLCNAPVERERAGQAAGPAIAGLRRELDRVLARRGLRDIAAARHRGFVVVLDLNGLCAAVIDKLTANDVGAADHLVGDEDRDLDGQVARRVRHGDGLIRQRERRGGRCRIARRGKRLNVPVVVLRANRHAGRVERLAGAILRLLRQREHDDADELRNHTGAACIAVCGLLAGRALAARLRAELRDLAQVFDERVVGGLRVKDAAAECAAETAVARQLRRVTRHNDCGSHCVILL